MSSEHVERASALEVRDTVKEQVLVFAADTVREVTVVTVDRNEAGDTLRVAQVTERDRVRDRVAASEVREKVVVRVDTVVVERRDSVSAVAVGPGVEVKADGTVTAGGGSGFANGLRGVLKWAFWLIVAGIVLIVVVRLGRKGILL